jgi:hypothetical protein
MKTTMKFLGMGLVLLALAFTSCSKDGEIGPMGPTGQNGINGSDGEDGNADVQVFTYNTSNESGNSIYKDIPELTTEVINSDLILGYLFLADGRVLPIPSTFRSTTGPYIDVMVDLGGDTNGGYYAIRFKLSNDTGNYEAFIGEFTSLKIIIAKSSNITTGKSEQQNLSSLLKFSEVDINDYFAVMDYFGIEY